MIIAIQIAGWSGAAVLLAGYWTATLYSGAT
jgi:hypothetical protein